MAERRYIPQLSVMDLRMEYVAARLLKHEPDTPWTVYAHSLFSRDYSHDILAIDQQDSDHDNSLSFHIAREGLYDILPEGVFHKTQKKETGINTESSVRSLQVHRQEEKAARKFFLPLEQEIYRQRIQLAGQMQKFWPVDQATAYLQFLISFWRLTALPADLQQTYNLLALLPYMHRIAGNLPVTAQAITLMFGIPVSMEQVDGGKKQENPLHKVLGEAILGADFFMGTLWEDESPAINMLIGPLQGEQLLPFLPGGDGWQMMDTLERYLLPADTDLRVAVTVAEEAQHFQLDEDLFMARLNYTTVI